MKSHLIPTLALGLLVNSAFAQDKPDLSDPKQKTSYALGMDIVSTLKREEVDVDLKALAAGVADTLAGKPGLTAAQQKDAMASLSKDMMAKAEARISIIAAKNLTDGQSFLAANAKKEGVMATSVVAPDGSSAELQYQILKSGTGSSPGITDIVEVNYAGSLIDGTVFDSSLRHGTAPTFGMKQVIPGWTAALRMMKAGDKWRLFIPPSLAYGESAPPQIGPNSTVIYDLELLSFYTPTRTNSASGKIPAPAPVK
jgi:FKBP-type peptidyl-prolyl cis-trans isomerase FklB